MLADMSKLAGVLKLTWMFKPTEMIKPTGKVNDTNLVKVVRNMVGFPCLNKSVATSFRVSIGNDFCENMKNW